MRSDSGTGRNRDATPGYSWEVRERFCGKSFLTLRESAYGADCMVLAFADVLREAGYVAHRYLWVSPTATGLLAAGMACIQLLPMKWCLEMP